MDGLIHASLKNPIAVTVMVLSLVVLGGLAAYSIPIDILPVFKSPAVQTLVFYSGMPAASIEKNITARLERGVGQASGGRRLESRSIVGISIVRDYFRSNVDRSGAMTEVNSLAGWEYPTMPPGTLPPVVLPYDPTSVTPVCLVALDSATQNEATLFDVGRYEVRPQIMSQPGAIAPLVYGGKVRAVMMYLDRVKLQARHLSPMDVMKAVDEYNVFLPPAAPSSAQPTMPSTAIRCSTLSAGWGRFRCTTSMATPRSCATWRPPRTPTSSRPTWCGSTASARSTCPSSASSARARSTWSRISKGRSIRSRRG